MAISPGNVPFPITYPEDYVAMLVCQTCGVSVSNRSDARWGHEQFHREIGLIKQMAELSMATANSAKEDAELVIQVS